MKKIIIEHSGSEDHNDLAQKLKALLEFEYECDTETMIGDEPDVILHWQPEKTNDLIYLASMKSLPSKQALEYYIKFGTL